MIRKGEKKDLKAVLDLIIELAEYEKAKTEVDTTVAQMEIDGFGANPIFGFFIAEIKDTIVGAAIYYYRYSTWKGKRMYLEDLVVTQSQRGKGIGKALFEAIMKESLASNCSGMMWQVLDWNTPAIDFYKLNFKSKMDEDWMNCSLEKNEINQLLNKH